MDIILCYDGLTGDLLKAELRNGTLHCSNDIDKFIEPLFQEYLERGIKTYLSSDSGFSFPNFYKTCEMNGGSWDYPRCVVFKIEKPYGQLTHMYTFIVTNMDMEPYQIIQFYCGRGKMENFIKEDKGRFDFAAISSHSKVVNANRIRLHMLAYNLFNWFR